ncbi:MAG: DUF72 domain-containing protein [Stenotrophomonas sp.]|nr:DUF72 domain-containing protein [Stenotrophomonas sp.]
MSAADAPDTPGQVRIGGAGWSLSRAAQAATYARWAASVPAGFRFAVKLPRVISHERRLRDTMQPLALFLDGVMALGDRLGPLLLQLPPSLAYEPTTVTAFLHGLRARTSVDVACEPRHPSWFTADVDTLLSDHGIARVAADPARVPAAAAPGGDRTWSYWRWHGQPEIYRSAYSEQALAGLAQHLQREAAAQRRAWCVLDNTALGHATGNALHLQALLQENAHA